MIIVKSFLTTSETITSELPFIQALRLPYKIRHFAGTKCNKNLTPA